MDDRNVVDAMHRLELIRRMRIQTMLRGTDAHRGQGPILDYIETHPRCTQAEAAESLGVSPPQHNVQRKAHGKRGAYSENDGREGHALHPA